MYVNVIGVQDEIISDCGSADLSWLGALPGTDDYGTYSFNIQRAIMCGLQSYVRVGFTLSN